MRTQKATWEKYRSIVPLILLTLPATVYLLVNNYFPMAGIFIAFKNVDFSKGIFASDWVGFQNFEFLFKTKDAWIMTRNTIAYNFVFIALGTLLAVVVAILLNEATRVGFQKLFQSSLILPHLISTVIISYIVYAFFSSDTGLVNGLLTSLGKEPVSWYSVSGYWPAILTSVYLWKNVGYFSIIFLSSIAGQSKDMYEAAKIDGAGRIAQIRYIMLPLLRPTIIMIVLMSVGRIMFSDFGLFYQVPMNSGALYSTTQTIDTYVYRALMQLNDIGMASAAGFYQSVVGFVVVLLANLLVKKFNPDDALF